MSSLIQSKSARIDVRASVAVKQLLQEAAARYYKRNFSGRLVMNKMIMMDV